MTKLSVSALATVAEYAEEDEYRGGGEGLSGAVAVAEGAVPLVLYEEDDSASSQGVRAVNGGHSAS